VLWNAASNRKLPDAVKGKSFREDLYYRLDVFPIRLPALRERQEDIPLLVQHFLKKFGKRLGKTLEETAPGALARLMAYSWPGNIRELQNVIERAAVLASGSTVVFDDSLGLPEDPAAQAVSAGTLEEAERAHILRVLKQVNWTIEGPGGAASILDLPPSTLRSRMHKLGIKRS